MGKGGARYLSHTAFLILSAVSGTSAGLWDVSIDLGPAPAPDEGPPFSAHAIRDRARLPYEVAGILGAYLGFTLILITLLLTVGRRLRKQAQAMADRPTEMVRHLSSTFDPPKKKVKEFFQSGPIWNGKGSIRSGARSEYNSPGMASIASFDHGIVERDRQNQQDVLAQLYGQVFAQHEQMSPQDPPAYLANPAVARVKSGGTLTGPQSPTSPRSPGFKAAYPKYYSGPTSPYYYEQPQSPLRTNRETRPASLGSNQTGETTTSGPGKLRKGVRKLKDHGLTISAPLRRDDNSDGARTPLSPRFYTESGIPLEPRTAGTVDSQYPPTTPGTARTFESDTLPVAREPPSPYPQQPGAVGNGSPVPAVNTSNDFIMRMPPRRSNNSPVSGTNNPLPLRALNDQLKQQQSQQEIYKKAFPLSPAAMPSPTPGALRSPTSAALRSPTAAMAGSMPSPGAFLSPYDLKSPAIVRHEVEYGGNRWGGAKTGPMTPYSPYMREAMVTPVSAHFATRAELKQRQKEDRSIQGAIAEEDQVADDKDIWGDAY